MKSLSLALALFFSAVAAADDVVLQGLAPGNYYVKIAVSADGTVSVVPLRLVAIGPSPQPQPPTPTPTPPPSPLTDRGKAVQATALAVTGDPDRANTAAGLAILYRNIAGMVTSSPPQITTLSDLQQAIKFGTDTFLSSRGVSAQWQPVRDLFSTQWALVTSQSPPAPLSAYAALLGEAADGLNATASAKAGINPQLLQLIEQIMQLILTLLQNNKPH